MDNDDQISKDNMSEVCLLVKAELIGMTPKQRRVDCIRIIYENSPKRVAQAVLDDKAIKKERSRERAKKSVVRHNQFNKAERAALRSAEAAAAALEEEEELEESEERDGGHGDLVLKTQRADHGETSDAAAAKGKGDSGVSLDATQSRKRRRACLSEDSGDSKDESNLKKAPSAEAPETSPPADGLHTTPSPTSQPYSLLAGLARGPNSKTDSSKKSVCSTSAAVPKASFLDIRPSCKT
jgi:hypothetical protein